MITDKDARLNREINKKKKTHTSTHTVQALSSKIISSISHDFVHHLILANVRVSKRIIFKSLDKRIPWL